MCLLYKTSLALHAPRNCLPVTQPLAASWRASAGLRRAFQVQFKQLGQQVIIGNRIGPAVGCKNGGIKFLMGKIKPGRPLIVEIRKRSLFQFLRAFVIFWNDPGICGSTTLQSGTAASASV